MSRSTISLTMIVAAQVGHRETHVRGADVGGEDDACCRVEHELGRWAAARGRGLAGRSDELTGQQCVDSLGHRGAAETRGGGELASGAREPVAQVLQERPSTVHPE